MSLSVAGLERPRLARGEVPGLGGTHRGCPYQPMADGVVDKLGAAGYVTKDSAPEELVAAIRKAAEGGKYVSPTLAERLASDVASGHPLHEMLSSREYEVLCMMASGKSVMQIADELALSLKTISTYRVRILQKMGMKKTAELVHYAISNWLVGSPAQDESKQAGLAPTDLRILEPRKRRGHPRPPSSTVPRH